MIDGTASRQIEQMEQGMDVNMTNMREKFRQGILNKVDNEAIKIMIGYRRQMSLLKDSKDNALKTKAK